jgi:hypothetical protein
MATFINEQSEEEIGSAMFSYTSHTMGKQEERKKSDRKTGKERRKAATSLKKSLRFDGSLAQSNVEIPSINTIWCIGRSGHWGTPMLDDCGVLIRADYCADCQHTDDKHKKNIVTDDELSWMSAVEFQLDMMEVMEEQFRLQEERRILKENKIQRMYLMNLLLASLKEEDEEDDYIPEIDDNFDD